MILAPSASNTVSKDRVNLASRSRIRNRGAMPSPTSSPLRLRACCVTQVLRHAGEVHPPGLEFDEEQRVEGPQEDGLYPDEVAGQDAGCLGAKELSPRRPSSGPRLTSTLSEASLYRPLQGPPYGPSRPLRQLSRGATGFSNMVGRGALRLGVHPETSPAWRCGGGCPTAFTRRLSWPAHRSRGVADRRLDRTGPALVCSGWRVAVSSVDHGRNSKCHACNAAV